MATEDPKSRIPHPSNDTKKEPVADLPIREQVGKDEQVRGGGVVKGGGVMDDGI